MRELEKIKKEREEERQVLKQRAQEVAHDEYAEEVLVGNPLTSTGTGGGSAGGSSSGAILKRRWNEDVVFKNQARDEPQLKKRFINDVIRSDFHRRFMSKYMG